MRLLTAGCAGAAQSMVPVLTTIGAALLLGEGLGPRELLATGTVVAGVWIVARGAGQ